MSPVIYDVILHNFNKVVKEKYGDKPVKVSELPWRDWWRECGARPVGQNNVAGHLALRSDMFEETIAYDEFPFLDDITNVTILTLTFCNNVDYSAFPKVKWISHITLSIDADTVMDISQLQTPLGNMEANTGTTITVSDTCKMIGRINLQKFKGRIEAPLKNNEAAFIIPNGEFQYFGLKYQNSEENYIIIDKQSKVPSVEAEKIGILGTVLILDKMTFINHFKAKNLWFDGLYFSDENKTIFNDGKYEKLSFDYSGLNGCNLYEVLVSFNGIVDIILIFPKGKWYTDTSGLKELLEKHNLVYYTQTQVNDAIDLAVNMRNATALTGGF